MRNIFEKKSNSEAYSRTLLHLEARIHVYNQRFLYFQQPQVLNIHLKRNIQVISKEPFHSVNISKVRLISLSSYAQCCLSIHQKVSLVKKLFCKFFQFENLPYFIFNNVFINIKDENKMVDVVFDFQSIQGLFFILFEESISPEEFASFYLFLEDDCFEGRRSDERFGNKLAIRSFVYQLLCISLYGVKLIKKEELPSQINQQIAIDLLKKRKKKLSEILDGKINYERILIFEFSLGLQKDTIYNLISKVLIQNVSITWSEIAEQLCLNLSPLNLPQGYGINPQKDIQIDIVMFERMLALQGKYKISQEQDEIDEEQVGYEVQA